MNDFGTSLLFFGVFVALVYVATGRVAYAAIGLAAFAGGSALAYQVAPQVAERVSIWLDPWKTSRSQRLPDRAVAVHGRRRRALRLGPRTRRTSSPGAGRPVIPEVQTDFIYSAIAGELGSPGQRRCLLCYILIAYRGFKIASRAGDGFSKLVAAGLTLDAVAAGVPDRRRRRPRRPADGDHPAVRQLRRLIDRLELPAARTPARGLRSGEQAGGGRRSLVNRQLIRLFAVTAAGFVLLLGFTTYWQLWASSSLAARQDNLHEVVREQSIDRGRILRCERRGAREERGAEDGRRTAHLRPALSARPGVRARDGLLVAHLEPQRARGVAERLPDRLELGPLGGARARVPLDHRRHRQGQRRRDLARPRGAGGRLQRPQGDRPRPAPQSRSIPRPARCSRSSRRRATTRTPPCAELRAWYRTPAVAERAPAQPRDAGPLPAGLDVQGHHRDGRARERQVHPHQPLRRHRDVHGVRPGDPQRQRRAVRCDRSVERADALDQHGVRADRLGALRRGNTCPLLQDAMARFGMYRPPQIDLPSNEVVASGLADPDHPGQLLPRDGKLDPARTAIGQYTLEVTPLQMAMVAGAIANGGVLMRPTLVDRVIGPGGRTITATKPKSDGRASSPKVAAELREMMGNVVKDGTGTQAALAGRQRRRQDRYGADLAAPATTTPGSSPSRPPGAPADRDRRRRREHPRVRRADRRADREGHDPGVPGVEVGLREWNRMPTSDPPRACSTAVTSCSAGSAPAAWRRCGCRGHDPAPQGRDQGARRAVRRGRAVRRALPPRGAVGGGAEPPEHRRDLRPRRVADGTYYIAMEYLDGADPQGRDRRARRRSSRTARSTSRRRSSPRSRFAHNHGVVHRDIKPHNVVVVARRATQGHRLRHRARRRLADDRGRLDRRHCPVPLARAGTRRGGRTAVRPVLLGIVLYEMLTGRVPFEGDSAVAIAMKHLGESPCRRACTPLRVPAGLEQVVLRALAKDAGDRYQTAEEMSADLDRARRGVALVAAYGADDACPAAVASHRRSPRCSRRAMALASWDRELPPAPPPPRKAPPRRARWPWIARAAVAAAPPARSPLSRSRACVGDGKTGTTARRPRPPSRATWSDKDQVTAQNELARLGLKPAIRGLASSQQPGNVVRVDPSGGSVVKLGTTVTLFVSTGLKLETSPRSRA